MKKNGYKSRYIAIVASVLAATIVGIAFAQYASTQANATRSIGGQLPIVSNGYHQSPKQGYYPYGGTLLQWYEKDFPLKCPMCEKDFE